MTKKLLITTGLAVALAFSGASAEEVKTVSSVKVKKVKKHHNDAYSPKAHVKMAAPMVEEKEVRVFAEVTETKPVMLVESKKVEEVEIKVKGKVDVQYGGVDQKNDFRHPISTAALPNNNSIYPNTYSQRSYGTDFYNEHALATSGEIQVEVAKSLGDNKYGASLVMNANPSPTSGGNNNPASKAFLFMESNIGRLEAGAVDGASYSMSPSADRIAKATGGIDGDFSNWMTVGAYSDGTFTQTVTSPSGYGAASYDAIAAGDAVTWAVSTVPYYWILNDTFLTTPSLPYASQFSKKANKLNFYSKNMNGFQFGLGFTRDTDAVGTTYTALSYKGEESYKNVLEGGLSYEAKMGDNKITLNAVGQIGETRPKSTIALKSLGAWEVGGKVQMDKITLAASYGDWAKSGTRLNSTEKTKAHFWTAGAAYDHKDLGVSLTYMNSERQGGFASSAQSYITAKNAAGSNAMAYDKATNKYQALSFGAEYQLMPGLTPYAEVTGFEYKSTLTDVKLNKGAVFLGGIKLNF